MRAKLAATRRAGRGSGARVPRAHGSSPDRNCARRPRKKDSVRAPRPFRILFVDFVEDKAADRRDVAAKGQDAGTGGNNFVRGDVVPDLEEYRPSSSSGRGSKSGSGWMFGPFSSGTSEPSAGGGSMSSLRRSVSGSEKRGYEIGSVRGSVITPVNAEAAAVSGLQKDKPDPPYYQSGRGNFAERCAG